MVSGIERASFFEEDADRRVLLDPLRRGIARNEVLCHAWCLMDTHYHFSVRSSSRPLAHLMKPPSTRDTPRTFFEYLCEEYFAGLKFAPLSMQKRTCIPDLHKLNCWYDCTYSGEPSKRTGDTNTHFDGFGSSAGGENDSGTSGFPTLQVC
jgi:hypothetical protein